MKKRLYIKTYGCQANIYDSQRMADIMEHLNFEVIDSPTEADFVIFNTCHIREKATEKLYSDLGRVRPIKEKKIRNGEDMIIAVAGCTAQAEGGEIIKRAPYVDMVFGPQSYQDLPEMVSRAIRAKESLTKKKMKGIGILNTEFPTQSKFDSLPEIKKTNGGSAYLSIQEGCDKFCHFCVVPYTRGAEYSRPAKDVIRDAKRLIDLGVQEITLLGQNVNGYHGESLNDANQEWSLGTLIKELANMDKLQCIRYITSHPRDVDEELILAHRDVEKLAPYLHLPVQSGSNRILKAMNRKHDRDFYLKIIDQFRHARADIAFSSDFIVGFPDENDSDHQDTLDIVRNVNYAQAYSFKYSKRPGTPAWANPNQIDESVKSIRLQELQNLLNEQQLNFNKTCVGKDMLVMFDKKGKKENQLVGRTPYMQAIHVMANERLLGHFIPVTVTEYTSNSLTGKIIIKD